MLTATPDYFEEVKVPASIAMAHECMVALRDRQRTFVEEGLYCQSCIAVEQYLRAAPVFLIRHQPGAMVANPNA